MNIIKRDIEDIKQNGYDLDYSNVFTLAFENYKKIALTAGLAYLVVIVIAGILFGTLIFGVIGAAFISDTMPQFEVESFPMTWVLGYIFFITAITALSSPVNAGLIRMAQDAAKGNQPSLGTAFSYYTSRYFKDILTATLVITLFTSCFSIGLEWIGYSFFGTMISLMISFFTFLTIPLIVFSDMNAMKAIEGSIVIVSKQFFILLALLIVSVLFAMLGFFGFCIGILFTMPFLNAMYYTIYAQIIGDEQEEETFETFHMPEE